MPKEILRRIPLEDEDYFDYDGDDDYAPDDDWDKFNESFNW